MTHLDAARLDAFVAGGAPRGADLRHVDACLACRRLADERGFGNDRIAAAVAAERRRRPAAVALVALIAIALVIGVVGTPLRGAAFGVFTMFQPRTVAPLLLTGSDLAGLSKMPDLGAFAVTRTLRESTWSNVPSPLVAARLAGYVVRTPQIAGLGAATYRLQSPTSELIAFDRLAPIGAGGASVALPADIAATRLRLDLGAIFVTTYEVAATPADRGRFQRGQAMLERRDASSRPANGPSEVRVSNRPDAGRDGNSLPIVFVQMPVPRVASSGVSVQRLVSFMVEQPGVPPHVAQAFRMLGDLSTTLPVPIPIDAAYTQPVLVDGVRGLAVGDDTGFGAAVIWQKQGMLYAVVAPKTQADVLAIAGSLR